MTWLAGKEGERRRRINKFRAPPHQFSCAVARYLVSVAARGRPTQNTRPTISSLAFVAIACARSILPRAAIILYLSVQKKKVKVIYLSNLDLQCFCCSQRKCFISI